MRIGYADRLCEWFTRELFPEDNFGPDNSALGNLNGTIMPARRMYPPIVSRAGSLYGIINIYSYREMSGILGNGWDIDK